MLRGMGGRLEVPDFLVAAAIIQRVKQRLIEFPVDQLRDDR